MVTRRWDTELDDNTMTLYADAAMMIKQQRVPSIIDWGMTENILEQWLVVATILLRTQERHQAVFEMVTILEAADEVNSRLRFQPAVQKYVPTDLSRLIQTDFNKNFRKVFASHLPVRWTQFTRLIITLTTR